MKIYFELENIDPEIEETSIALGTFDGLHIGHMEIIEYMKEAAVEKGLKTFVYTFSNHPREILTPENVPSKIMDVDEKVQIFTRADIDYLALVRFDEYQLGVEPEDFIKDVLIDKMNMRHLTVGYDYRFGKKARGDVKMLMDFAPIFGYTFEIVQPIMKNEVRVSSSLIRELLRNGQIEEANFYLGRHHFVKGCVVKGKGMGKGMGIPTANLRIKENISTIKPGVYITETIWKGRAYHSATNVGFNPTFEQTGIHMETYMLGIDEPLYGETIEVHFIKRIRDELKFSSIAELVKAMENDIQQMKLYFSLL